MLGLLLRHRPDVIVTTGAAPGYFALRFGKLLGARTIWIDSMANAEATVEIGPGDRPARRSVADAMGTSGPARGAAFHGGGAVIFLTTGTQLPFDRLVRAVDAWLDGTASSHEVCAQVLPPARDPYVPRHFETVARFSPAEYAEAFDRADLIVSHAGMGTILTALTEGKRICIMPRQMRYGEHRNDHQLSTAQRLGAHPGLFTARDEHDLPGCLDAALQADGAAQDGSVDPFADQGFTDRLREFILTGRALRRV